MRSMMRDLGYSSCLLAIALTFALAWRSPFVEASSAHTTRQAQLEQPNQ